MQIRQSEQMARLLRALVRSGRGSAPWVTEGARSVSEKVLRHVADVKLTACKNDGRRGHTEPDCAYDAFVQGAQLASRAAGRDIYVYRYNRDAYFFVGSEEEILARCARRSIWSGWGR